MKRAVFDNPMTKRRELWIDGEIRGFVTKEMMDFAVPGWSAIVDAELGSPEQWVEGRLDGDPESVPDSVRVLTKF